MAKSGCALAAVAVVLLLMLLPEPCVSWRKEPQGMSSQVDANRAVITDFSEFFLFMARNLKSVETQEKLVKAFKGC